MKTLRDYQQQAIDAARNIIRAGKSPLLVAPTGAGKTGIALSIAGSALSKGCRVLIVIPLNPILRSFYYESLEWIKDLSILDVAILAGSDTSTLVQLRRSRLLVAMAQTIEARRGKSMADLPWQPDLIIYDEAHLSLFRDCFTILNNLFPKAQKIAVTATPKRLDGAEFPKEFVMHQVTTTAKLISQGFLVPYKAFKLGDFVAQRKTKKRGTPILNDSVSDEEVERTDFTPKDMEQMLEVAAPSKVWEEWQKYRDKHTIAFVPTKKVGDAYVKYFQEQGQECILITEKMSSKQREAAYTRFREEKIVLFSITVLATGFDEPCATVCLLLRPTQSLALLIQMIGRVLRLYPGKDMAYVMDFTGCILNDGMFLPADIHDWEKLPNDSGKECEHCNYINAATAKECAECGCVFQKVERAPREEAAIEEELFELDFTDILQLINKRRDDRRLMEVRSLGATNEERYKFYKQRAFLMNHNPGKAFMDFRSEYRENPSFDWDRHAVFQEPTYEDVLDYYCYLKTHQQKKNKPFSWVATLMRNEFSEFLTNERWKHCVDTFAVDYAA